MRMKMMDYSEDLQPITHLTETQIQESQVAFMQKVYGWMLGGLGLTGLIAYYVYSSGLYIQLAPYMLFIALATLGIVLFLSFRIDKMTSNTAMISFIVYSALNGVFFSTILAAYEIGAIYNAFFVTAGTFGALSVYGFTTKKDLSGFGKFLFMGLVGIILASIVNIWVGSSAMDLTITVIGVLVFSGLTAYHTQMLKNMHHQLLQNEELARKGAIMGALALYLDFINLFLMILRLFGGNRS